MKKLILAFCIAFLIGSAHAKNQTERNFTSGAFERIEIKWSQIPHMSGDRRRGKLVFHYVSKNEGNDSLIQLEIFEGTNDPFGEERKTGRYDLTVYDLYAWDGILYAFRNQQTSGYAQLVTGNSYSLVFEFFRSGELVHSESYERMGVIYCIDIAIERIKISNKSD